MRFDPEMVIESPVTTCEGLIELIFGEFPFAPFPSQPTAATINSPIARDLIELVIVFIIADCENSFLTGICDGSNRDGINLFKLKNNTGGNHRDSKLFRRVLRTLDEPGLVDRLSLVYG